MRSLVIATSVALALGSAAAIAQTPRVVVGNTSGNVTVTSGGTSSTAGASSSSTTTTNPSSTVASGTDPLATGPASSASTGTNGIGTSATASGSGDAFGTNTTTSVPTNSQPSFGAGSSFSNDSGNTALGTSPGQTSSGTAAGNSSSGIGAGSASLEPSNTGVIGTGPAATNPDGTALGTTGVNVVGERVPAQAAAAAPQSPSFSIINTPTFDQAAREGRAKEQARKARGQEPRVYGIAPRTENDLTWQMPDDKIIRY